MLRSPVQGDALPAPDPHAAFNNWLAGSKKAGVRALQVRSSANHRLRMLPDGALYGDLLLNQLIFCSSKRLPNADTRSCHRVVIGAVFVQQLRDHVFSAGPGQRAVGKLGCRQPQARPPGSCAAGVEQVRLLRRLSPVRVLLA